MSRNSEKKLVSHTSHNIHQCNHKKVPNYSIISCSTVHITEEVDSKYKKPHDKTNNAEAIPETTILLFQETKIKKNVV